MRGERTTSGVTARGFTEFCATHHRLVVRRFIGLWQVPDDDALDATQEVFVALARRWPLLATEEHRINSMWAIARNKRADLLRARTVATVQLDECRDATAVGVASDPVELTLAHAERLALHDAVRRLPAAHRTAVLGRYFRDRSYAELAAETGRSPASLRQDVSRAVAALRIALRQAAEAAAA